MHEINQLFDILVKDIIPKESVFALEVVYGRNGEWWCGLESVKTAS